MRYMTDVHVYFAFTPVYLFKALCSLLILE